MRPSADRFAKPGVRRIPWNARLLRYSIGEEVCGFAAAAERLLGMAERQESITENERGLVSYYLEHIAKKFIEQSKPVPQTALNSHTHSHGEPTSS